MVQTLLMDTPLIITAKLFVLLVLLQVETAISTPVVGGSGITMLILIDNYN